MLRKRKMMMATKSTTWISSQTLAIDSGRRSAARCVERKTIGHTRQPALLAIWRNSDLNGDFHGSANITLHDWLAVLRVLCTLTNRLEGSDLKSKKQNGGNRCKLAPKHRWRRLLDRVLPQIRIRFSQAKRPLQLISGVGKKLQSSLSAERARCLGFYMESAARRHHGMYLLIIHDL